LKLPRFLKFVLVGLLATAMHIGLVMALVEGMSLAPVLASLPAFLVALSVSYLINHHWTFAAAGPYRRHLPRYALVALGGLILNAAIMYSVVDLLGASYFLGLVVVIMVVPVLGYMLQRGWSFGRVHMSRSERGGVNGSI